VVATILPPRPLALDLHLGKWFTAFRRDAAPMERPTSSWSVNLLPRRSLVPAAVTSPVPRVSERRCSLLRSSCIEVTCGGSPALENLRHENQRERRD
jgi:hypothetical protein